jgi:hypothetical protein
LVEVGLIGFGEDVVIPLVWGSMLNVEFPSELILDLDSSVMLEADGKEKSDSLWINEECSDWFIWSVVYDCSFDSGVA